MTDYRDVINTLNQKLMFNMRKIRVIPDEKTGREVTVAEFTGGLGFAHHYGDASGYSPTDAKSVDTPYTTHRPHYIKPDHDLKLRKQEDDEEKDKDSLVDLTPEEDKDIREQGEDIGDLPPDPETATEPVEEPPPEDMGTEPDMGGDPGMGEVPPDINDPGMGGQMPGMPGQEEPKTPGELGRTYEMKKIYARLVAMNEYLAEENSAKILKTKQTIGRAIDLFAVIGANPNSYKDKIDEIIVSYYKFLEAAYKKIKTFYRSEATRVGGLPALENNEEQNNEDTVDVEDI